MNQTFCIANPIKHVNLLKNAIAIALKGTTFVILGTCASHTLAEDNTQQISDSIEARQSVTFEPIVITATRTQKKLSHAPVAVQLLDQETLQKHNAHTLKQALELLPNISIAPVLGKTGYQVRMQGFSGDQVLVLIDGSPLSASTGSAVNLIQYLNTDIEQIEIIQGAASAQYGSSAMGGVINIITKQIIGPKASITAELGTNGSQNPSDKKLDNNYSFIEGSIEGALSQDDRLKARLSGSYIDDKGLTLDHSQWPQLKDATQQSQVQTKFTFTPNVNETASRDPSSRYWIEAAYYKEEDVDRFNYSNQHIPVVLFQQREEDINRKRFSAGGQIKLFGETDLDTYRLSGSVLHENYDSDSFTKTTNMPMVPETKRDFELKTNLAQLQLDMPAFKAGEVQSHTLQVGMKWQEDEMQQQINNVSELTNDKAKRDVVELYLQDDWSLGDNTNVLAGVRYQNDSDFGDYYAPKVAIIHDVYDQQQRKHTLRASAGQGYRVPNLKERYHLFDHSVYGYKVLGDPELQPEKSTSYQIGYQTELSDSLGLSVNGFYNDIKNLIQVDRSNPTQQGQVSVYHYDNINKARTYGGDVAIDWAINEDAKLNLGYAYLEAKNKTTNGELTFSPKHRVTANMQYQVTPKLQLVPQLRYESKQLVEIQTSGKSPSWWRFDARANYAATPNLDMYLAVNNAFDKQRSADSNTDMTPLDNRQWLIGASYNW